MPEVLDPEEIASKIPEADKIVLIEDFDGKGFETNKTMGYEFESQGTNCTVMIKFKIIEGDH